MTTSARVTRKEAEAAGFTVDTHCYPWFGYKGSRFSPSEKTEVYTDLEAELRQGLAMAQTSSFAEARLTQGQILEELRRIQRSAGLNRETDAQFAVASKRVLDATFDVLLHTPYRFEGITADIVDDNPSLSLFFYRYVGDRENRHYHAQLWLQMTANELVGSGRIVQALEPSRYYDDEAVVFAGAPRLSELYVDHVRQTMEKLDEQVKRVSALEGFSNEAFKDSAI